MSAENLAQLCLVAICYQLKQTRSYVPKYKAAYLIQN